MPQTRFQFSSLWLNREEERGQERALIFCILLVLVSTFYAYYPYLGHIKEYIASTFTWSTFHLYASIVLLLCMSILYFYAASFYKNRFYLCVGLAWIANLLYLIMAQVVPVSDQTDSYLDFRSLQMLLAIVTDAPLYLASLVKKERSQIASRNLFIPISAIILWFVIRLSQADLRWQARLQMDLAVLFATYVSFRVYRVIDYQIEEKTSFIGKSLFKYSFLIFALLQPTFLLVMSEQWRFIVGGLMIFALGVKAANGLGLVLLLREDYAKVKLRAGEEEALVKAEKAEEILRKRTAFEEIGILAAGIEHELRTPIGVLATRIRDLQRTYQSSPELVAELKVLEQQKTRLLAATRIIKTLRSSQEVLDKKMEATPVVEMVRKAVGDIKNSMTIDGIFFTIEEDTHNLHVRAYKPLLQQAFVNILKNAVESIQSHKGSGKIEVEARLSPQSKKFIEIRFCDNGIGLPEKFLDKLTAPGFTMNKQERENSGLGLFVTERIINIHKGKLELKNSEKGGAIVSVILPRYITKKQRGTLVANSTDDTDDD